MMGSDTRPVRGLSAAQGGLRALGPWPELAGRGHARWIVRLGMLLLLSVAVVACTALPDTPATPVSPLQLSAQKLTDVVLEQARRQRQAPGSRAVGPAPTVAVLQPANPKGRASTQVETQLVQWLGEQVRQQPPGQAAVLVKAEDAARAVWKLQPSLLPVEPPASLATTETYVLRLDLIETATGQVLVSASERVADGQLAELSRANKASSVAVLPKAPVVPPPTPAETLQTLSADYVALLKAGQEPEAQRVFARWLETSLQARSLNLKLLFAPSSSRFYPDPALVRRYEFWLAELARQLQNSPHCLQVVGHTSRSGREDANRRLSLLRANAVKQILLKQAPALEPRISVLGLGWDQALPASAADEGRVASEQRADFKVVDCS